MNASEPILANERDNMKAKYIIEWDELQLAELPFLPNIGDTIEIKITVDGEDYSFFKISSIYHVFNANKEYEKTVICTYPT
jgi:hypothetical protein